MSEAKAAQGRFPSLEKLTLAEALSDSFYLDFITADLGAYLARNPRCAACNYRNRCMGGRRGRATLEGSADLMAPDPDACLLFRGGYYDRARELIESIGA